MRWSSSRLGLLGGSLAGRVAVAEESRRGRRVEKKGREIGIKGVTLNLHAFSLSVSLIYIRGVTIANGLGP
jgi:hypothetical protein